MRQRAVCSPLTRTMGHGAGGATLSPWSRRVHRLSFAACGTPWVNSTLRRTDGALIRRRTQVGVEETGITQFVARSANHDLASTQDGRVVGHLARTSTHIARRR